MEEYPLLDAAYREEAAKQDGIIMLALNIRQSSQALEEFERTSGYALPILMDPSGYTAFAYHVSGLPSTFFIDRAGIIRAVRYGPFTSAGDLRKELAKIGGT